jgi:hypothetical protein
LNSLDVYDWRYLRRAREEILLMNYYEFATRDELNNTITGTAKDHTGLTSQIGIFRQLEAFASWTRQNVTVHAASVNLTSDQFREVTAYLATL